MPVEQNPTSPIVKDWKYRLGLGLFIYSFVPILTIEILAFLPLDAAEAVTLGAIYIGSGEIACLAAIALLGKPFIQAMKDKIKATVFPRAVPPAKPKPIGKLRHQAGVGLLLMSLVPYYATIGFLLFRQLKEGDARALLYLMLVGEALFLLGLFVLGEEFWARLKRLFEWPGKG